MIETITRNKTRPEQKILPTSEAVTQMNFYGGKGIPFFFLISYDMESCIIIENPLVRNDSGIQFDFPASRNFEYLSTRISPTILSYDGPSSAEYADQFDQVQQEFQQGKAYLLNLTQSTPIESTSTLKEIFFQAKAKYKVYNPGNFVVFSPETFVRIFDGKIYTYPMKGTIRTDIPRAKEILRDDPKEKAEHASVVDLLRNDLGQVATSIKVNRFRYMERIRTEQYDLWQASSEIEGKLPMDYNQSLGDLMFALLPAGSITGVPKASAVNIIRTVERHDRGFYTGICGFYDGKNLDSGVMIRFIEQTPKGLIYKSGGGIHQLSDMQSEYQELIQKIYVPVP